MAVLLKGAYVVSATGVDRLDMLLEGGTVSRVGEDLSAPGAEVVDLDGKYLLAGGIDVHTHFDLPLGDGMRTADGFASGGRAALAGGTTCVVDYATQFKGETLADGLRNWHRLADGKCFCDYAFHMAITDWNERIAAELPDMAAAGVTSFKMYMAYKGTLQVDDGVLYRALKRMRDIGGLLCVHCENGDVIAERVKEFREGGQSAPVYHALSRPVELENEAIGRLLTIAELADSPVYVVHISGAPSMRTVVEAKENGLRAFAETCPQYLYLDDSLYEREWGEAAKYVCSPPLRGAANQATLWNALSSGTADVVATDHCSFNLRGQKDRGRGDFSMIPNGMPGVETRMLLLYKAAAEGRITLPQLTRIASANPASIFGMSAAKGSLSPGKDADIVVIDPDRETVLSASTQFQNVDYSPFEGVRIPGAIHSVYLRGAHVFQEGRFLSADPAGKYVHRRASGQRGV